MRMLLMNTSGSEGVVALADSTGVLATEILPGRGSSEGLMPAVRRLFPGGIGGIGGLDALGVVIGPGSFTGVRVGLSAAKGLCEALGIGMVAISRLALVAGPASRSLAVLDAGRGEFYAGLYGKGVRLWEELLTVSQLEPRMDGVEAVSCEVRVQERLPQLRLIEEPGAEAMRVLVLARIAAGAWSDVALVDANYLRRTDAELLVNAGS